MRKRTSPDRIASILRDIRADLDAGLNVNQACRKAGINPTTYYRWKALQEDPVSNEQFRMCEFESEVGRLKTLVAELALDRRNAPGGVEKNAMTAARRRLIATDIRERFHVSQRRVSRALDLSRSGLRYAPVERVIRAALARRIWALLVREGWSVNKKAVRRIWRLSGLKLAEPRANPKSRRPHRTHAGAGRALSILTGGGDGLR